jgi:uncharacterized protein (TIGR00297 family)
VLGAVDALIGIVVTVALAAASAALRALTPAAAAVAAAFGIVIVLLAGFGFLLLLAVFVVVSSLATRYRFDEKVRRRVQEGSAGERGISNVVAHIVLPTALAAAGGLGRLPATWTAVLFAAALAFATSDTLASEFGVLSGSAVSILSLRPVEPGTNGGISAVGEMFALAGAVGIALVGGGLFVVFRAPIGPVWLFLLAVGLAGFLACQVDSLLGEVLENRGYLTKGSTNFLGMLSGIAIAALVVGLAGRGV